MNGEQNENRLERTCRLYSHVRALSIYHHRHCEWDSCQLMVARCSLFNLRCSALLLYYQTISLICAALIIANLNWWQCSLIWLADSRMKGEKRRESRPTISVLCRPCPLLSCQNVLFPNIMFWNIFFINLLCVCRFFFVDYYYYP